MASTRRKIGRPLGATLPVSRDEFDRLKAQLQETMAAVERLQQDDRLHVQRIHAVQRTVDRLTQHLQALTAALRKPHKID